MRESPVACSTEFHASSQGLSGLLEDLDKLLPGAEAAATKRSKSKDDKVTCLTPRSILAADLHVTQALKESPAEAGDSSNYGDRGSGSKKGGKGIAACVSDKTKLVGQSAGATKAVAKRAGRGAKRATAPATKVIGFALLCFVWFVHSIVVNAGDFCHQGASGQPCEQRPRQVVPLSLSPSPPFLLVYAVALVGLATMLRTTHSAQR
jgi:hypothetical protein